MPNLLYDMFSTDFNSVLLNYCMCPSFYCISQWKVYIMKWSAFTCYINVHVAMVFWVWLEHKWLTTLLPIRLLAFLNPFGQHVKMLFLFVIVLLDTNYPQCLSFLRSSLQSVRDAISNQVSAVFQLYEQNTDSLDLLSATERSTTAPSVADMLEWLQDAERHYRQQYLSLHWVVLCSESSVCIPQPVFRYLRRKGLLQMLKADNLSLLESAPNRWKSLESPSAEDNITGAV